MEGQRRKDTEAFQRWTLAGTEPKAREVVLVSLFIRSMRSQAVSGEPGIGAHIQQAFNRQLLNKE